MLIPRFTLRWLLGLTTFCAGVSLVLSYAVRGNAWAIGVSAGLWSLVIVGLFYVAAFLAAWLMAQAMTALRSSLRPAAADGGGESPFAVPISPPQPQPAADSPPPITG
jgi:Zn-dependent protease with chaperone function